MMSVALLQRKNIVSNLACIEYVLHQHDVLTWTIEIERIRLQKHPGL